MHRCLVVAFLLLGSGPLSSAQEPLVKGWLPLTSALGDVNGATTEDLDGAGGGVDRPGSGSVVRDERPDDPSRRIAPFADTDAGDFQPASPDMALWLTTGNVFRPLVAATHETRFFASWQRFHTDPEDDDFGTIGLGGEFPVVRFATDGGTQWQVSLGAVAISIFNLDGDHQELINTDFAVGLPVTFRNGPWSGRVRVYHLSSHIGDDPWILATDPTIVEERQSFESLEVLLARDFDCGLRVYGGGERMFHSLTTRDRWSARVGTDFKHRASAHHRWVAGADLNLRQQTGWRGDFSAKAGVEVKAHGNWDRAVGLFAEYYHGHVPYGQFWDFTLEYWGIGLTFTF